MSGSSISETNGINEKDLKLSKSTTFINKIFGGSKKNAQEAVETKMAHDIYQAETERSSYLVVDNDGNFFENIGQEERPKAVKKKKRHTAFINPLDLHSQMDNIEAEDLVDSDEEMVANGIQNNRKTIIMDGEQSMEYLQDAAETEKRQSEHGAILKRELKSKYRKSKFPSSDDSIDSGALLKMLNDLTMQQEEQQSKSSQNAFIEDGFERELELLQEELDKPTSLDLISDNKVDLVDIKPLNLPKVSPKREEELSLMQEALRSRSTTASSGTKVKQATDELKRKKTNAKKAPMLSGKMYIPGDRLISILGLHTSAVVNGGSFIKPETAQARKAIRVQFSGYDEVIPSENDLSDNSLTSLNTLTTSTPPSFSPLDSPSSPPNTNHKKRREIVAPDNFEYPSPPPANMIQSNSPVVSSPIKPLPALEKELPLKPMEMSLVVPLPPPIVKPQNQFIEDSKLANNVDREKKRKVKRRHIQIQARPVEYRTVGVQVGASSDPNERNTDENVAWEEERIAMEQEIYALRNSLLESQSKLEVISGQAYQRMMLMLQEKQQLEQEVTNLFQRLAEMQEKQE